MAKIVATGQQTIVDLSDARHLTAYLASNLPGDQIYDPNNASYAPDWTATNLKLTPTIYINNTNLPLATAGLTVTWKRKDGASAETALTTGETVSGGILTVNANNLAKAASGMLTYIALVSYLDPELGQTVNATVEFTYSMIRQAANAHNVSIDGEQVFKYDKNGTLVGSTQIVLNASATNVTISRWQYKKQDGSYADYPTTTDNASITGATLIVKPSHAVFFNNVASIKVTTNDPNVSDIISIAKIYDGATGPTGGTGAAGRDAISVLLSNEAQVLAANSAGACLAATVKTTVMAYQGITKITPTVAAPTGLPSGMTFSQTTSGTDVICSFTISANATLGGANAGTVDLAITAGGQKFTKTFSWSKAKTGATGAAGVGIKNVTTYYLASSAASGITTSTSGWTTSMQTTTTTNKYLWSYQTITYTDDSTTKTTPVIIGTHGATGATGNTGAAGNGIKSVTAYYLVSSQSSGVTTSTSGWSTTPAATTTTNKYLWSYQKLAFTNGSTVNTTPAIIGTHGATGATGAAGQNAVVFSVYAPNGTLVQNGKGTVLLDTAAYDGSTVIASGATYQWAKYINGAYQNVSGGTGKSLTVSGTDIANIQTYRCTMTYKSKTYTDVITVEDKTDSLVATVTSTGGSVFKNGQGDSIMTCLLYANGSETDALLSANVGASAPASPKTGDLWYKVDKAAKTVVLMKYSGSAWAAATEKQAYTYEWYRMDKNGNSLDAAGKPFKTGKVIYITSADVDSKLTLTVQVSE